MHKKVFQLIVENSSGVLSRISGLFSRRGYNIESITAGVASPGYTRITIVASGDSDILEQIEKQVAKLIDVISVTELKPEDSVYRELLMIKLRVHPEQWAALVALTETDVFRANIIDVAPESMIIELTGTQSKVDDFIKLVDCYDILEIARTGIAGLTRGTDKIVKIEAEEAE